MRRRPLIGVTTDIAAVAVEYDRWSDLFAGFADVGADFTALDWRSPHVREVNVERLDGLVLSGGADVEPRLYQPRATELGSLLSIATGRDRFEFAILERALTGGMPVLAICRGAQLANVALGGDLLQDIGTDRPGSLQHQAAADKLSDVSHQVTLAPNSRLARWCAATEATIAVNSRHHQGIDRLADNLIATAHSPDGLIEGYEDQEGLLTGVQWHPEYLWRRESTSAALLSAYVRACQDRA